MVSGLRSQPPSLSCRQRYCDHEELCSHANLLDLPQKIPIAKTVINARGRCKADPACSHFLFGIDIETCTGCGGKLKVIASIEDAGRGLGP